MDHHEKILQEVRQALSELRQEEKTAGQEALGRLQELRVKYLGKGRDYPDDEADGNAAQGRAAQLWAKGQ